MNPRRTGFAARLFHRPRSAAKRLNVVTLSMSELEALKAAALAEGFEWGGSRRYEGHLEGEIIVA